MIDGGVPPVETLGAVIGSVDATVVPLSVTLELASPCAPPEPLGMTLLVIAAALVVHVGQEIAGVVPPLETMGVVPVTAVTVPLPLPIGGLEYAPLGDCERTTSANVEIKNPKQAAIAIFLIIHL